MPLWKSIREYVEQYPLVKSWVMKHFSDEATRTNYVWFLKEACKAVQVKPDELLSLLTDGPNPLFLKLKQHLEQESHVHNRKAHLEKAAVVSFVQFHNDRNTKFFLNIPLTKKQFYSRDEQWNLKEFEQVIVNIHRKYRPLLRLGVMAGLGRKEMVYLNKHFKEVKDVEGAPQACYLSGIPGRKQNSPKWTAILPKKEFQEYKKTAPVTTFGNGNRKTAPIQVDDLSVNFKAAAQKAGIYVKGVNTHESRRIFKTLGLSPDPAPNVSERNLDQNMGHIDSEHYDKTHLNLKDRSKALTPLWEYMRRGGPATASMQELSARDKVIETMQQQIDALKGQFELVLKTKITKEN